MEVCEACLAHEHAASRHQVVVEEVVVVVVGGAGSDQVGPSSPCLSVGCPVCT